ILAVLLGEEQQDRRGLREPLAPGLEDRHLAHRILFVPPRVGAREAGGEIGERYVYRSPGCAQRLQEDGDLVRVAALREAVEFVHRAGTITVRIPRKCASSSYSSTRRANRWVCSTRCCGGRDSASATSTSRANPSSGRT